MKKRTPIEIVEFFKCFGYSNDTESTTSYKGFIVSQFPPRESQRTGFLTDFSPEAIIKEEHVSLIKGAVFCANVNNCYYHGDSLYSRFHCEAIYRDRKEVCDFFESTFLEEIGVFPHIKAKEQEEQELEEREKKRKETLEYLHNKEKGFIYFIQSGKIVKIGKTKNVKSRVSSIKSHNPDSKLIYVESGYTFRESELHERFKYDRYKGEWFHYSEAIKKYIEEYKEEMKQTPQEGA